MASKTRGQVIANRLKELADAADRIDELEAENERLREELANYKQPRPMSEPLDEVDEVVVFSTGGEEVMKITPDGTFVRDGEAWRRFPQTEGDR